MHSIRLGRVLGIEVRADWSVVVIAWLLTWDFATIALPGLAPSYSWLAYWTVAGFASVVFLATLLAHEMSHSLAARRRGIAVRDITLWMLGGIATIEGEAHTPRDELAIALAGPATSAGIGAVGVVLAVACAALSLPSIIVGQVLWIAVINVVLALFNLAPAAPLDGGRVLRAWLWHRSGDRTVATIKAAHAGRTFAWILIAVGFVEFAAGAVLGGLWLLVLGWFVFNAARAEEQQEILARDLAGVRVRDVMTPNPVTAPDSVTVAELVDDFVLASRGSAFPLVASDGRVTGLTSLSRCKLVPEAQRSRVLARDIAEPLASVAQAAPGEPLLDVLRRAVRVGGRVLVFDRGRLVGIVTPTDVMRALQQAPLRPHERARGAA